VTEEPPTATDPAADDLPVEALGGPRLDARERTLDPRVVQLWRAGAALGLAGPILVGTGVGFALLGRFGWLLLLAGLVALVLVVGWYPRARYERWRWRLTPLALELRHGVLVHRHESVPYFRIQQIDVTHGPLDRMLGLASLQVTTASASGSATIPGIAAAEAPTIRSELLEHAAAAVRGRADAISDAV
jgi:uncharacterized protein